MVDMAAIEQAAVRIIEIQPQMLLWKATWKNQSQELVVLVSALKLKLQVVENATVLVAEKSNLQ